jgi:hypothetical protein
MLIQVYQHYLDINEPNQTTSWMDVWAVYYEYGIFRKRKRTVVFTLVTLEDQLNEYRFGDDEDRKDVLQMIKTMFVNGYAQKDVKRKGARWWKKSWVDHIMVTPHPLNMAEAERLMTFVIPEPCKFQWVDGGEKVTAL